MNKGFTAAIRKHPLTDRNARQQLDVYYRVGNSHAKVVMVVPGGAWSGGDKSDYKDLADSLTGLHGLTTVVVNYRLTDAEHDNAAEGETVVEHPDHVRDVAAAFSWIKRNIAPFGDPAQVYVFGQSAGAHLVSLMATDRRYLSALPCATKPAVNCALFDIRGVIAMSGAYDLPALADQPNEPGLDGLLTTAVEYGFQGTLSTVFGSDERVWWNASPIHHINPDQPPFLILYSYADMPGFARQAHDFSVAVKRMWEANDPEQAADQVQLRRLERIDYSRPVWAAALCRSAGGDLTDDDGCTRDDPVEPDIVFTGHYAEVVAINPQEPENTPTRLVVDFIAAH